MFIVTCGAGKFKNVSTNKCEDCPPGTYQPETGKTECLRCPSGTVIVGSDVKNVTSCKSKLFEIWLFALNRYSKSQTFYITTGTHSGAYIVFKNYWITYKGSVQLYKS